MTAFFEAIQWLFVDVLFVPLDLLRKLELSNWWLANLINWTFMIICAYYVVYWCKQLKIFNDRGEEDKSSTSHSFLK